MSIIPNIKPNICHECDEISNSSFRLLSEDETQAIARSKTCFLLKKNQVIFTEGSRLNGVFCINKGKVKLYKLGIDGKEQIIDISKEGSLLGFRMLLAEEPSKVSAETLESTSICFIPKKPFLSLLSNNIKFQGALLKIACQELGVMTDSITNFAQKPVRERLAGILLVLMKTYGTESSLDFPVEINLSRDDLANIIGTATETAIRILREFKDDGLIQAKGRKITVLEPKKLMVVARTS